MVESKRGRCRDLEGKSAGHRESQRCSWWRLDRACSEMMLDMSVNRSGTGLVFSVGWMIDEMYAARTGGLEHG